MSSNLRLHKVCLLCGKDFVAKTTVTQFCGDSCAKKAYKLRQREQLVEASNNETLKVLSKRLEILNQKEILSLTEACMLTSVSRWTLWRMIKAGKLRSAKLGKRVIIRKEDLNELFETNQ